MIDVGLARLVAAVQELGGVSPAQLVDALPDALLDPDATHDDDVCLLSFRLAPAPTGVRAGVDALSHPRAG